VSKSFNGLAAESKIWSRRVFEIHSEGAPSPRVCHSSVLFRDKLYIFGGHNPEPGSNFISRVKDELFEFDLSKQTWRKISGLFPFRTEHSSVCSNGEMIVFGGYSGLMYQNDIFICELGNEFKHRTIEAVGDAPRPCSAHSICIYKNKIYMFGGWDGRTTYDQFYKFSFVKSIWKKVKYSGQLPEARRSHGCAVVGDQMYIFGGYNGDGNVKPLLYCFNFITKTWSSENVITGTPPCGRSRMKLLHYFNTLAVFGGWDRVSHFQKWYEYNLETRKWRESEVLFPGKGIGQHSAVVYNNCVYVFGGYHEKLNESSNLLWGFFLGHLGRESMA